MEKRADIQIYMLVAEPKGKDDPELIDNSLYTPIQCGANDSKYDICELKDNKDPDNIYTKHKMPTFFRCIKLRYIFFIHYNIFYPRPCTAKR